MPPARRAAVLRACREPLVSEEVPIPTHGPGEVPVKVMASGVCHTDIHAAHPLGDALRGPAQQRPRHQRHPRRGRAGRCVLGGPPARGRRLRGTVNLVGPAPGTFPTPVFELVLKRITVRGSIVGTRRDLAEALASAAEGRIRATVSTHSLEAVNEVFDDILAGRVDGRVALVP